MLVLTRRSQEEILLEFPEGLPAGEIITIRVCNVQGGRARLGITAPLDVHIRRAELVSNILMDEPVPASPNSDLIRDLESLLSESLLSQNVEDSVLLRGLSKIINNHT